MKTSNQIIEYLDEIIPNPTCELTYNKDYELLLSVMLSAQTTDKRVNSVTEILYKKYPTLNDISMADIDDIIDIIKPIGTFRKKAFNIKEISKRILEECNGIVPNNRSYLESLPGVGRKTANVVLSNLYNVPCIAVDTHVERVTKRLTLVRTNSNVKVIERTLMRNIKKDNWSRRHLQLVLFGRYYCKAKKPLCDDCQLKDICKEIKKK